MSTDPVRVRIQRLREGVALPQYMTGGAAGVDLSAAVEESVDLEPGCRSLVPTGIAIALPPGYEAQLRPRSGLAIKQGVTLLNSPGTVDADYRGEVRVILVNLGEQAVRIRPGDRIAQMIVSPVSRVRWEDVDSLDATGRGSGGFGHTS